MRVVKAMARLNLSINDELTAKFLASADRLWSGEGIRAAKAIAHLIKSGDLCIRLSARLERKLRAFAAEQYEDSGQGMREVDDALFLSWLRQGGSIEPTVRWEIESLPNNGGIYRMLMKGGQDGKSVQHNQG